MQLGVSIQLSININLNRGGLHAVANRKLKAAILPA